MSKITRVLLVVVVVFLSSFIKQDITGVEKEKFVVVLDAGHGGKDPGKYSKNGYKEKDIALNIVLKVGKELEKNPDIKVIYTRKTDVFVDLFKRGKIANEAKADLFVSVHCNAHHTQAHGSETYVLGVHRNKTNLDVAKSENEVILLEDNYQEKYAGYDPNSPESLIGLTLMQEEYLDQSLLLASYIQEKFTNSLKRKNRGVKQAGFIVLHQTVMPSVLIETGFITNKNEGAYLNSTKGQSEVSSAIVKSIVEYKDNFFKNTETEMFAENNSSSEVYEGVVFKVQLAASSKNLPLKSYNFKGLGELSKSKQGKLYKYFSGNTNDYEAVKKIKNEAVGKGYASCFIVAYKNGVKTPLAEILKK